MLVLRCSVTSQIPLPPVDMHSVCEPLEGLNALHFGNIHRFEKVRPTLQQTAPLGSIDLLPCAIVVVDESAVVKEIFQSTSVDLGVELKLFSSASAAMALLNRFKPDLVVMDIMLPDKDGLTFLQELRKTALHCDTPMVMITTKDYAQDRLIAQHLGVLEFVVKPISPRTAHDLILKFAKSHGGEPKKISHG